MGAAAGPKLPILRQAVKELEVEIPKVKEQAHQAGLIELEEAPVQSIAIAGLRDTYRENKQVC